MSNEIIIKYKVANKRIRLFGNEFVNNNKEKCKIIIDEKEYELKAYHEFENYSKKN